MSDCWPFYSALIPGYLQGTDNCFHLVILVKCDHLLTVLHGDQGLLLIIVMLSLPK